MKKLLFSLAFIAATLTSCLTDKPGLNYEGKDSVNFSIGINVPELATRAGETGMNSGLGAIDNFSADEWAEYDLRYMLEVYDVSEGYENLNTPVKQRMVQTFDEYQETTFELRLIPNRTYKFVVWADFVLQGTEEDLNYNTANLKEITRTGYVSPMDECMDAYFVQEDIEVTTTLSSTLTLTRPFGKIRVIATDAHEVNIGSTPSKVDVTFYNHPTFFSLNALSGAVETEVDTVTYSYDITKEAPYTEGYDAEACNQTLFADYIFADTDAQETNFVLTVWGEDGRVIREHDFNTQIPLKRNHLTTIMGNLLTTATEFNVSIDDNFDGETPINVNPDAPKPTTFVFTSAEVSPNYYQGWNDFNIDFYTDNSDLLSLNLFNICSDSFIPEETYDVMPSSGCIYTEYYSYFKYNGATDQYQFKSVGTVTVSVVNDQYVITMSGLEFTDGTEFNGTFTGLINGLDTPSSGNQGGNVEENTGYKVYARTELGWTNMNIWPWTKDVYGNDVDLAFSGIWPGDAMETAVVDGVEYFVYTLPADIQTYNLVFSTNNGTPQTVDFNNCKADRDRFFLITSETYDNKYIVKDITDGGNEGGEEDVVELSIVSHDFGYTADMETEVIFICDDGNQHIVDFRMNGIEAGTYNDYDNSIILGYCRYMHGNVDYNGGNGVVFDSANATIVDNGDTTFTFDVTFVAEGATFHFTYTTPSSEPVVYDPWTCSYTYTGSPISGATFTLTGTGENQDVIVIESVKAAQIEGWLDVIATRGDVVGSGKAYISYGDYKCYFNVTIGNVTYIGETDALF